MGSMGNNRCTWMYRPGTHGSHWARTSCKGKFVYLSKIKDDNDPKPELANEYNGRLCSSCGRPIEMCYLVIENNVEII